MELDSELVVSLNLSVTSDPTNSAQNARDPHTIDHFISTGQDEQ
jgi:hypothetical protein